MQENIGTRVEVTIEEELKTSFLDYAMSVIIARALPDVRNGAKSAPSSSALILFAPVKP